MSLPPAAAGADVHAEGSAHRSERVTLQFDLSHCSPQSDYTLHALGRTYALARHSPQSLAEHRRLDPALALIPEPELHRITHYAADVEVSAHAVKRYHVTTPAGDPARPLPDLVLVFVHVPLAHRRQAIQLEPPGAAVPPILALYGVAQVPPDIAADVHLHVHNLQNPIQTAAAIVFHHPELYVLQGAVAYRVLHAAIRNAVSEDPDLWTYISSHCTTWSTSGYVTMPDGTPARPAPGLTDRNGQPVQWPQQDGQSVIPRYSLADGTLARAQGAVWAVLQSTRDDTRMDGVLWSRNHGITARTPQPAAAAPAGEAADGGGGYRWGLVNQGSGYGLDVYPGVQTTSGAGEVTVKVKNTRNRSLCAYVQFLDETGAPILNPSGWQDRVSEPLQKLIEPNPSKKYLNRISPGNVIFGIPAWTDPTPLTFAFPPDAVSARVMLGGLGHGRFDMDVDLPGIVLTCVMNYGVPLVMDVLSVGVQGTSWYMDLLKDRKLYDELVSLGVLAFAGAVGAGIAMDSKAVLTKCGELVGGIIFNAGCKALAVAVTERATALEVLENVPFAGWMLRVASVAASVADMAQTTVAVLESPPTYVLLLSRTIRVRVSVGPDPAHGGDHAVWPAEADHYQVLLRLRGGTLRTVAGSPLPPAGQPIDCTFDDVPAAPGALLQATVNVYSKTGWLCGKWGSGWVAAQAQAGGATLALQGAIRERVVPLGADTVYGHDRKLVYQAAEGGYAWQKGPAPAAVWKQGGTGDPGHQLLRQTALTLNDQAYALGYTWQASGLDLPLVPGGLPSEDMGFTFQSIGVLADPRNGLKQPGLAFALPTALVYDPFGPVPLVDLPATPFSTELDQGVLSPALRQAFTTAGHPLPEGAVATVVTAGAAWTLGGAQGALYDARRQADRIQALAHPAPAFSQHNFYVDPRVPGQQHLRQVTLNDGSGGFDYTSTMSWGTLTQPNLDAVVVHPERYAVGVSYDHHKLEVLHLPGEGVVEAQALAALPVSGRGVREGLVQGPVAATVTPDHRLLVLEQDNHRIQAFDPHGNPVQCFAGTLVFALDGAFAAELDAGAPSTDFVAAMQRSAPPALAPLFHVSADAGAALDQGQVSAALRQQAADCGLALPDSIQVTVAQAGQVWLLRDPAGGVSYDLRVDPVCTMNIDVRHAARFHVEVRSPGAEWLVRDTTNVQTFLAARQASGALRLQQRVSTMGLVDGASPGIRYLDVAAEARGFLYVLSYATPGEQASDYRLDIYDPDGTHLARTGGQAGAAGVNAARLVVDPWRTVYTLNYEAISGPGGRTEPSVSAWLPSTPSSSAP